MILKRKIQNTPQLNCHTTINGNVELNFNLKEPITGFKEKVLLYWYQARGDTKSQVGDLAIIESVQKRPVKAIFVNENIKAKMILDEENPFKSAYIVDVATETINDKPVVYKILDFYERLDKPENE